MNRSDISHSSLLMLLVAFSLQMAGCGGPPPAPKREYADVTGKVTYKGEPLKTGQVMFQPATGALVTGDIKSDGAYSLKGVVGANTVMIVSQEQLGAPNIDKPESRQPPKSLIPEMYGTPNGQLKFDVKAGQNKADFDLK